MKRQVILVTDGDKYATEAVVKAGEQLGCPALLCSSGNPSSMNGKELVEAILQCDKEPVLVMFDDGGFNGVGSGESALRYVVNHPDIITLGAIAVASNSDSKEWTHIDIAIDRFGELTPYGVDKEGYPEHDLGRLFGDTVYSLDELDLPVVVGVGDIGKLRGVDDAEHGAPITKKAIELILERSGNYRPEYSGLSRADKTTD
ncbi:stage V sporulation protein AE [Pullulanibacillus sp. KACC 23026]|uniref:stage V sporulation protein AE n=1 Tax=Pullulanibacillus sp. KACC 23026 TaxID=3028315 RepID=UPI0023B05469|nr:stage V sporulation protein AE [Pullulanibacillus sp. KACC 23026]WEG11439.1 stage V sporulation protein AE [Pullulanibacillus sp. KACC 23026]